MYTHTLIHGIWSVYYLCQTVGHLPLYLLIFNLLEKFKLLALVIAKHCSYLALLHTYKKYLSLLHNVANFPTSGGNMDQPGLLHHKFILIHIPMSIFVPHFI